MKTVFLLQARMGSRRLPGKVLLELAGEPLLVQVLRRLQHCRTAAAIVVATTTRPEDEAIVSLARQSGVGWWQGSEDDVLGRLREAAQTLRAEIVVRVTADCPLLDPEVCDLVVASLQQRRQQCDYASNVLRRTYPRGLDVEAMFLDTLLRLDRLAVTAEDREHVTSFLRRRPELFLTHSVEDQEDNSDLRWTVDTAVDLALLRRLYQELDLGSRIVNYREIVAYVRARPELARYNQDQETWDPRCDRS